MIYKETKNYLKFFNIIYNNNFNKIFNISCLKNKLKFIILQK